MGNISDLSARLIEPEFYLEPEFHTLMRHLRENYPVHWTQAWPNRGFWSITRYVDIKAVAEQPILFSNEVAGIIIPADTESHLTDREAKGFGMMPAHTDPPKHDEVRRLFARYFTGPAVAKLEPRTQALVDEILDGARSSEAVDFVMDIAAPLPARLICELVGVPEEDRPLVTRYVDAFANFTNPKMQLGSGPAETFQMAMSYLLDYMAKLVESRRKAPRDDLASVFAHATLNGEPFAANEAVCWAFSIFAGGFETSRSVIASGLLALIKHPDQMELLRQNPGLINQAVNEMVRWSTPFTGLLRVATADTEVAGQPIARGDWLVLWWYSANRDETIFDHPYKFDISLRRAPSLAFGHGTHNCIGRMIALLETKVMIRTLVERSRSIELTGPVEYNASLGPNGPGKMPIKISWVN